MGFANTVHFYLPNGRSEWFDQLSILNTQITESKTGRPPFPHAVFVLDTSQLDDSQCMICNFNIAVSRPAYAEVKGGNHARGTSPQAIRKHWSGFKNDDPNKTRMRRSHWHDGYCVPLLVGKEIAADPNAVGYRASSGVAELLLESPFDISDVTTLRVFSKYDHESLSLITSPLAVEVNESCHPWYSERDRVPTNVRAQIDRFFADDDQPFPELNFDQRR